MGAAGLPCWARCATPWAIDEFTRAALSAPRPMNLDAFSVAGDDRLRVLFNWAVLGPEAIGG
eukprot:15193448-Alexandrium_andersonii.AAC.1